MAQKMKIALTLLSGLSYGGVTYFRNLIPALAAVDKRNEYHLFIPAGHPLCDQVRQANFVFHQIRFNARLALLRHLWEQLVLPGELEKIGADILFTAKNAAVFGARCTLITSIRNMEPLCFQRYRNDWRLDFFSWFRRLNTVLSIRRADVIVAVSQAVKKRVVEVAPGAARKTFVVYNGRPEPEPAPVNPGLADDQRYILTASKFVAYANQLNLVKGYKLLCDADPAAPRLVMAGGVLDQGYFRRVRSFIRRNGLQNKVVCTGLLRHEELAALYARAEAFVFPSTLEACPQTLLEAMANRLPIAASFSPPMPEICFQAAVYFVPDNPPDIAAKLKSVLQDQTLRSRLKDAAFRRAASFSWKTTAVELIRIFQDTLEQKKGAVSR
ncbi:MAG TPA: glycosyltransferase family 1 protein [Candidatus Omnitrophota bacterium]|nr:glycosyltransferase family 1 protein [Candidatus Omnitrophota bacterium]HRZ15162.1 glycosyltransferase family 1 protein [Candidatus Omnitrophota bacterium]